MITDRKHSISGKWPRSLILLLVFGVILHAVIFFGVRTKARYTQTDNLDSPFLQYIGRSIENSDTLLSEQSIIFDSEPLALPTRWNYSITPEIDIAAQKARSIFEPYDPTPLLDAKKPAAFLASDQVDKIELSESGSHIEHLLYSKFLPLLQDFGSRKTRRETVTSAIVARVEDLQTGKILYQQTIEAITATLLTEELWSGDSFLLWVDPTGSTDRRW